MGFWKILRVVTKVAKPIASILGIKKTTVAGKAADVAEVIDQALPPPDASPPSTEKP